jgi:ubiquinone biosynthesis protein UbiJ
MENGLDLSETGKVNLDMKTLVGIVIMIMSIATVYFSLQGKIAQLELDVIRMQDSTAMNTEFRIKWPRGELGALPDDAVQDINIQYIKEEIEDVEEKLEELEKKIEEYDRI